MARWGLSPTVEGLKKMANKLKSCPFCGGRAEYSYLQYEEWPDSPITDWVRVECTKCGICYEDVPIGTISDNIKFYNDTNKTDAENEAARVWNSRATDALPEDTIIARAYRKVYGGNRIDKNGIEFEFAKQILKELADEKEF